jgi:hypothetical protein
MSAIVGIDRKVEEHYVANPTTAAFTTTTFKVLVGWNVFFEKKRKNFFISKNELGLLPCCLQVFTTLAL